MRKEIIIHLYNPHGVIYQASGQEATFAVPNTPLLSRMFFWLATACFSLGALAILIYFLPSISFLNQPTQEEVSAAKVIAETVDANTPVVQPKSAYQPRFNPSLSDGEILKIPSIGVDTTIQEATSDNYEEALKKGVWRVSDFGTPSLRDRPVILAAHRYGYILWSNLFRRQSSFYNLPKLNVGDVVEIDWQQRKYLYEIYKDEKGEKISDYSADLILYTCESLNSPVRIFKYGRLLEL